MGFLLAVCLKIPNLDGDLHSNDLNSDKNNLLTT